MATLADLLPDVLGRIEENLPTATPPGPIFVNLTGEVYPQMVYAMFEAALITGVVQLVNVPITLAANQTWFFNVPKGSIAPLRMRAPYAIRKASLAGLDMMIPNWQQAAPGTQIQAWFPLGVNGFGIYPQMAVETQMVMDFIVSPTNQARPYDGSHVIPFQSEFTDLTTKYAAAALRSKEGGVEAETAATVYGEYMEDIKALSLFQNRLDALVFSGAYGGKVEMNPRKLV
jgi:hypothetical protein